MTDGVAANRSAVTSARRWVVKTGSALVVKPSGRALRIPALKAWARQIGVLRERGIKVLVVSSGSIGAGMSELGWTQRPEKLAELQAAAAIGQPQLANAWDQALRSCGARGAQVLMTRDDVEHSTRGRNAAATLEALLSLDAVPVINENDTVATEQIQFGDNDTLAAHVLGLAQADLLVILTDQDGMYTADPRQRADAERIPLAAVDDSALDRAAEPGAGHLGRGGMVTKLRAARIAAERGACTVIADGTATDVLVRLADGEALGSLLRPPSVQDAPGDAIGR